MKCLGTRTLHPFPFSYSFCFFNEWELFRKLVLFSDVRSIKGQRIYDYSHTLNIFNIYSYFITLPKSYLKFFFPLNFTFISVIVPFSSGKNSTLLSDWIVYDTRNHNYEVFQILVIYISFIKVLHLAYNKITYSLGSINRSTERTEVR